MIALPKLAIYNQWANERLLQHLENMATVPDKTLELLSHTMNAQIIWLNRIQGIAGPNKPFDQNNLTQCRHLHETTSQPLINLSEKNQEELAKIISYHTSQGDNFETSVEDILLHIFNHGTYHRAQIALQLRSNNLEPINTDYITFVRNL